MSFKVYKESVNDSFQAYLVEGANFTQIEEYPILEPHMVSSSIPHNIMSFDKAVCNKSDLSNTFISFYTADSNFERVRLYPKRYLNFFKKTAGIIGFDFSVHDDMPIIEQKSQINLNLKLTYFYAKNGIKIIPNIRCGSDELQPEFFDSIPKHSLISIGVHGFIKHCYQKHEWVHFIRLIIDYLNPTGIIVVGHLDQWIKDIFKKEVNFYQYDSYMDLRNKEVLNNVN